MEKTDQNTHFSVTTLKILYQWKWHILIATFITLIAGIVFSSPFFITPKYSSDLILYPPHTLTSKTLIYHEPRFGSDLDADQHIQLLTSGVIADSVINMFNLVDHYEIDTRREKWQERLSKIYNKNISIRRTKFNSIRINVKDKDPRIAAEIAWSIAKFGDNFRFHIFRTNLNSTYLGLKREYNQQEEIVNELYEMLEDTRINNYETAFEIIQDQKNRKIKTLDQIHTNIDEIRNKYGIYDLGEQINLLYEQIVIAHANYIRDSSKMNIIKEYYKTEDTVYINLKSRLTGSRSQYVELSNRLKELTKSNASYSYFLSKFSIEQQLFSEVQLDHDEFERSFQKVVPSLSYFRNRKQMETEFEILLELRRDLVKAKNNMEQEFLKSYIVQTPGISSRPSHPKRLFIAVIPTILVFVLSCFVALFSSIYIPKLRVALKN